ncbi:MAG: hypothetical protein M1833_000900 [Piccolia ochrophora]|nr:MAG: hypothetical protein M1833_000900 [Piccolia ochrophora]
MAPFALWDATSGTSVGQGLAVSGGVDSMALATLCSQLVQSNIGFHLDLQAFVLDHDARVSSDREASRTREELERLGIPATIVTIQWDYDVKTLPTSDFETLARQKRYQALGAACRDHGIRSILLGHHEDDQAETVLMRLAAGQRSYGLSGMKEVVPIPECFGMYGISESGSPSREALGKHRMSNVSRYRDGHVGLPLGSEDGGVTVFRPLLPFNKQQLIATCRASGTHWIEDSTNGDVSLTTRNAVRHLLATDRLPMALRKPRLLRVKDRMVGQLFEAEGYSHWMSHSIVSFDTRTGRLVVRFPLRDIPDGKNDISTNDKALYLIRKMLNTVSSRPEAPMAHITGHAETLIPVSPKGPKERIFSIGDVHLTLHSDPRPATATRPSFRGAPFLNPIHTWILTRSQYPGNKPLPALMIPPSHKEQSPEHKVPLDLWDGRFWIGVQNNTPYTLKVRPFRAADMMTLRRDLRRPALPSMIEHLLQKLAPGQSRFTLPAIVIPREELDPSEVAVPWEQRPPKTARYDDGTGDVLLALPSLNYKCPAALAPDLGDFGCHISYKKVDFRVVEGVKASAESTATEDTTWGSSGDKGSRREGFRKTKGSRRLYGWHNR